MRDPLERYNWHAKRVLDFAVREALSLSHNYIGTEHLLLALTRQTDTVAFKALGQLGVTPHVVYTEVTRQLERMDRVNEVPLGDSLPQLLRKAADALEEVQ